MFFLWGPQGFINLLGVEGVESSLKEWPVSTSIIQRQKSRVWTAALDQRENVFLLLGHLLLGKVSQVFMVLLGHKEENRASRSQEVKELPSSETP